MWGKKRSKYGEFVDKTLGYGGQDKIVDYTGLNKATISKACNDQEYRPTKSTMKLLIDAAWFLTKQNIKKDDFWM
jgi:putative transcriptional regulator